MTDQPTDQQTCSYGGAMAHLKTKERKKEKSEQRGKRERKPERRKESMKESLKDGKKGIINKRKTKAWKKERKVL